MIKALSPSKMINDGIVLRARGYDYIAYGIDDHGWVAPNIRRRNMSTKDTWPNQTIGWVDLNKDDMVGTISCVTMTMGCLSSYIPNFKERLFYHIPLPPHCLQAYADAADRPCNMRWSQRPYLDLTHIQTILGNSNSNTKLGVNNIKSGTCEVEVGPGQGEIVLGGFCPMNG
ncbi:hypothetical protein C349_05539 [Cryptococcus neoformans var. grubii Br795]|nr:hypothetical protein C368_05762 [Cryptococcus neoformans var. grubii 125.91]OXG46593.1 hypothetical protein C355_05392 [Cryptococcus neoformans var. grubii Th84]OXG76534.1 hypothetical protein C349_05539 [Cryptococcus neoformans var. grubii Br795]OXH04025.1 hypothetical protein J010_05442 [Cryptococcus neoformans var. grubii]OXH25723.1 hypothetical protein J009_05437 [Cryptococcus neoformans var. grubii]